MWWLRALATALLVLTSCVPATTQRVGVPQSVKAEAAQSALAVTSVVPEPNASAVLFDSTLYVQFNHPVVPLTTLDHPATEQPIRLEPATSGTGKWLTTGLYTF